MVCLLLWHTSLLSLFSEHEAAYRNTSSHQVYTFWERSGPVDTIVVTGASRALGNSWFHMVLSCHSGVLLLHPTIGSLFLLCTFIYLICCSCPSWNVSACYECWVLSFCNLISVVDSSRLVQCVWSVTCEMKLRVHNRDALPSKAVEFSQLRVVLRCFADKPILRLAFCLSHTLYSLHKFVN